MLIAHVVEIRLFFRCQVTSTIVKTNSVCLLHMIRTLCHTKYIERKTGHASSVNAGRALAALESLNRVVKSIISDQWRFRFGKATVLIRSPHPLGKLFQISSDKG